MHKNLFIFFLVFNLNCFFVINIDAQSSPAHNSMLDVDTSNNKPLTILYDIEIKTKKNKPGIEETYNGGNKTVFISGKNARVRLVSLMRIQSIFFTENENNSANVSIIKESGKQKFRYNLKDEEWLLMNKKYDSLNCFFIEDSIEILKYNCKKAIVTLKDGKEITVFYSTLLKPIADFIEPAFKCIPGLVLQYSYETSKGSITYTAGKINQNLIVPSLFKVPLKGYVVKKFCKSCPPAKVAPLTNDDHVID